MARKKSIEEILQTKAGSSEYSETKNEEGMYLLDRGPEFPEFPEEEEIGRYDRIPVVEHPKFGTVQADAYVRLGYRWERYLTDEEKRPARLAQDPLKHSNHVAEVPNQQSEIESLKARIIALEDTKTSSEEVKFPEKPLKLWNHSQLMAKAQELNLEVPVESTNKEIVSLIESEEAKQL